MSLSYSLTTCGHPQGKLRQSGGRGSLSVVSHLSVERWNYLPDKVILSRREFVSFARFLF